MPLAQHTARPGILIKIRIPVPRGRLARFHGEHGMIVARNWASMKVVVNVLPVPSGGRCNVSADFLVYATDPPKEIIKAYCTALRDEYDKRRNSNKAAGRSLIRAMRTVGSHFSSRDHLYLVMYWALAHPNRAFCISVLADLLEGHIELLGHFSEKVDKALHDCSIELAQLYCFSGGLDKALDVIKMVARQYRLSGDRRNDCINVLRAIMRMASENERNYLRRACLELLRLNINDTEARQLWEANFGDDAAQSRTGQPSSRNPAETNNWE